MWGENQIVTILSFKLPGVLQDWNPLGGPGLWGCELGHNKSEPSLTPCKPVLGESPYGFNAPAQQCWRQDVGAEMVQTFLWMLWIHWAGGGRVETIAVLYPELWKGYNYSYPSAWVWAAAGKLLTDRFFSCLFWASNSQSSNSLMPIKGDVEFPLHLCEGDLQAEWNTVVEGLYLDVIYLAHEKCKKIELYWHHISCCWVKN